MRADLMLRGMAGTAPFATDRGDRPSSPPAGDAGLFGPGSMTWRIYREHVLLAGGGCALLLQVSHPLVGAGVFEHSDFEADPWGRLLRTLDAVTTITFGTTEEAQRRARRIWGVHGRVRGVTDVATGRHPAGTPYDARDARLAMWVHATLVDTGLRVYHRYVAPLDDDDRARFYHEQKRFAEAFGVPRDQQPESYSDFRDYIAAMHDELACTPAARDVLSALAHPPLPLAARPLRPALVQAAGLATTWLLPTRLREELGLPWGPVQERMAAASVPLVRTMLAVTPGVLRDYPQARRADRRVRAAA